ncbi:uncharacterized protein LOC106474453, partial [Limulus polyphemus]|uniref:Uncharacterized protein LOC106474453 n=1 Tax=Limulus polyphemus TaxID=6850 RepID=A0ABM1BXL4_LIMPO
MSSSSGSSSSGSDESDSEESSVSGRSSPEKHGTQGWGLANFMEKKVVPPVASLKHLTTQPGKHMMLNNSQNVTMDLADEDSVNWILGKYSSTDIKDYLQSPSPHFVDFDSGNLPLNPEIDVLISPVLPPAQEEQFNSKYGSGDGEQISKEHLKTSGQDEMSFGQTFRWSGDDDRLIGNDFPKLEQQNVKIKTEENQDGTELEEGPEIAHDEFSTSFYSCPEMSRSFALRADSITLSVSNSIQPCYNLENSTISCSTSLKSSSEEVRKKDGNKKSAVKKETSKKYNSYSECLFSVSGKEEKEYKGSEDKNTSSNSEVKPKTVYTEEKLCKNFVIKKVEKNSASKMKPKELVSDTSKKELYTSQMSSSSKRIKHIAIKEKSDLFSVEKTSSCLSGSLSNKQPEEVRENDHPVKPHVTDVINRVAEGDLSCSNTCLNSDISAKRSDHTTSSLVIFDDKVKIDPPISVEDPLEAQNELKENAIPCVFVSIDLALITRVPACPPGKRKQQDSVRHSPRMHLKEIKQDSNRSSDCLNPAYDTVSSVKRKKRNRLKQLPCKPEENKRGDETRHIVSAPTRSGFPEPQAAGKEREKEVDILWNYTPTPKSPGCCDSQSSFSVSSYFRHQSPINVSSWSHKDAEDHSTKHKPKGEIKSQSEDSLSHSSAKKLKKKEEKQRMKRKESDFRAKEKSRNKESKRSRKIEESAHSLPSQ